ncbi:MAG: alpha-ketoacid dehydrogenase subunit beta [Elusimicrobia bacterium CG1_02_37_114]|nr:MAG: alpha-ketoacid dehydrogenase subunit beta [Elusimicrobia bacterium CG1_02_37_114]PIV53286.1 MAG: alpha-ketoacid dehydrogenase subunit beta [Elusimicrobia bacterium CG02_land_8_20_14_3_00_37_13]PIZ13431.1 MAG: alpha-ketoacid dehydrogenase subunit beta [Elusimicrobia bacterium CG_4_10_14_0_8_um_filter_37_32]
MKQLFYWQAINEALEEEMKRDPNVFVMGEDVAIYGGAYGVTRGLMEKFGEERVRDTAISEAAIAGAGLGAAVTGMRPVIEIMYIDFISIALDQIYNQMAKIRYMFGGKTKVPIVVRTQGGPGRTLGAHHSQSLESWLVHVPGLKVVMPATPYDAKGLLKSAIREDNPVIFIEHKMLYGTKGEIPEEEYTLPIGKASIKREGSDVTIIAYSMALLKALKAAEQLQKGGINCEVIDPLTLLPLDIATIMESVKKTHKVVIVHEACKTGGTGAEIGMQIIENGFDYLDAPIKRVCGADVPMPKAPNLEKLAVPQVEDIIKVTKELCE